MVRTMSRGNGLRKSQGYSFSDLALNFLWKSIAKHLTEKCSDCGKERLLSIFDTYAGKPQTRCARCSLTYAFMKPLIYTLFLKLGVSVKTVCQLFQDRLTRRSILNAVKGVAHFGIMKPQPTGVPVVIVWNFTNKCNLNCLHCHQNSSPHSSDPELTPKQVPKVIDKMGEAGVSILTFSGGEPLLRSDLYDAIKRATDCGMLCTVASNGTLLTRKVAEKLVKAGIRRIEIGLDGATAETHDFLRNTEGSFDATIRGIKNCADVGFDELCTTMTFHSKNVDELEDTIKLAEQLGATRFYLNRLIPAGRGIESSSYLDAQPHEIIKALETLHNKFTQSVATGQGIQCYSRGMTYYARLGYERSNGQLFTVSEALSGYGRMFQEKFGTEISKIVRKLATGFGGCSAGLTYCGLTVSGDLIPCVPAPVKLGNLLEQDLEDIWVNNKLLNYIRNRRALKGSCGKCRYNGICGGCRYTAYVINGDWLGPDPSCPFGPSV